MAAAAAMLQPTNRPTRIACRGDNSVNPPTEPARRTFNVTSSRLPGPFESVQTRTVDLCTSRRCAGRGEKVAGRRSQIGVRSSLLRLEVFSGQVGGKGSRAVITDVVEVAWRANGSPALGSAAAAGSCSRCSTEDRLSPTLSVVSRNFSGYDGWADPSGLGLCRACTWAYRNPMLRTVPHLIIRWPELLQPLDCAALGAVLGRPVTSNSAVVVPLRPGRKHVVSGAAWGHVVTDDQLLTWGSPDVARLHLVNDLRAAGFGADDLYQPAPPYRVVARLEPDQLAWIFDAWDELRPWRTRPAWLQVAARTQQPRAGHRGNQ